MEPPSVVFKTTDGGRVRFNPNLYNSGKVCLSVLGTWHGPAWSSAESISSVLLSIQSLMCAKPYHNEPGYENRGDAKTVGAYSDYIRYETLRVAVIEMLEHPYHEEAFGHIVERQFLLWYDMHYRNAVDLKTRLEGTTFRDPFSTRSGVYRLDGIIESLKSIKAAVMAKLEGIIEPIKGEDNPRFGGLSPRAYATEKLQDEYEYIQRHAPTGVSASPRNRADPFIWDVTIMGPDNTPWEGGLFPLEILFCSQHPFCAPFVRFTCETFHPNITSDGIPALDMINSRWNPETRIVTILNAIHTLLSSPSSLYPVNLEAACLYMRDRSMYDRKVRRLAQDP